MAKKSSRQTHIQGDVNVANGDFVAGDKTIAHERDVRLPGSPNLGRKEGHSRPNSKNVDGSLDAYGGDVVLGDKIIKFFQRNLNLYLFKDVQQLLVFLGFFILVSGVVGGTYWYSTQPTKMTGDYNIAIAQFGEIQENGTVKPSKNAERIQMKLFGDLQSEYDGSVLGLNVQVEDQNMPLVTTHTQAKKLADKINADIVIYGVVVVDQNGDQANFQPRFYVAEHPDTGEITGTSELAVPIHFDISDLYSEEGLTFQLRTRTEILLNFTKALIYFSQKDYGSASRAVTFAINVAEKLSEPFEGEEALYLLAAKSRTQQKQYENAHQALDQALHRNPDYARAHLARGNIYYELGKVILIEGKLLFDEDRLMKAKTEYQSALDAADQPEDAYIPIKAHTSLGNVFFNLAQVPDNDPTDDAVLFSQAADHYMYVIHEFERTRDPALAHSASISYYGLGGAYRHEGKLEQALQAYQLAYDLMDDPDFRKIIDGETKKVQSSIETRQGR